MPFVAKVPGPATPEEMRELYPHMMSFAQLKGCIEYGDLGLLKRHPDFQKRYHLWCEEVKKEYGTLVKYLVKERLEWDEELSTPKPTFAPSATPSAASTPNPLYFRADLPTEFIKILPNDWPYSVPPEVFHFVIWSKVPAISSANIPLAVYPLVKEDGLWGFTGNQGEDIDSPILPNLPPKTPMTELEKQAFTEASKEFDSYVKQQWPEDAWECAWLVNPPRLQSIPGLAHIHVFARKK